MKTNEIKTNKSIKTVGELKEFIKDLPDDMLLVNYKRDMEKRGYQNKMFCNVANMKKETIATFDAFDGIPYNYEVFIESEEGVLCLIIN